MERKRVEKFEESLCEDCGRINLVFLQGFSLKILSGSSLSIVGNRGIYTRVERNVKSQVFYKTGVARGLQATRQLHTCQACQKLKSCANYCTTGQKPQAGQAVSLRLELATQPSREVKLPGHPIWEKLTFHIPFHPTIYRPLYPRN